MGSVKIYMSDSSSMTSLAVRNLVWSTLWNEINSSQRRLSSIRQLQSLLINDEACIDGLYFVGDETASTNTVKIGTLQSGRSKKG
jgi:hypothetical protein